MRYSIVRPSNPLLALGLLAILGCTPVGFPPHAEWVTHTTQDGRVSASFPRTPKTSTATENSSTGPVEIELIGVERGATALMIGVTPLKFGVDESAIDGVLNASRDAAFPNGEFLERGDIDLSGYPGKSSLVRDEAGHFARTRICVIPDEPTLVQVMCIGPREFVDSPDALFFLDSVSIK